MRRLGSVATAVVLVLLAIAPTRPAGAADAPSAVTVSMKQFMFMPASITVAAGGTVTWTYDEQPTDVPGCESPVFQTVPGVNCPGHSATADAKKPDGSPLFDSGVHRADGFPFTVTLATPGTYTYFCVVHGGANPNNPLTAMNGQIVVVPGPAPAPQAGTGATTTTVPTKVEAAQALPRTGGAPPLAAASGLLALVGFLVLRWYRPT